MNYINGDIDNITSLDQYLTILNLKLSDDFIEGKLYIDNDN